MVSTRGVIESTVTKLALQAIAYSKPIGHAFDGEKITSACDRALELTRDFKLCGENPVGEEAREEAIEALKEAISYGGSDAVIVYITAHSTSDDQFKYLSTLIPVLGFTLEAQHIVRQSKSHTAHN